MKRSLFLVILFLCGVCLFSSFNKKPKTDVPQTVYVFGFSASFTDSTIYFTAVQPIPDVILEKKTRFLPRAAEYSYQLKEYLEEQRGEKNRFCAIFSEETKSKAEKKMVLVKNRYQNTKNLKMIFLSADEFQYTKPTDDYDDEAEISDSTLVQ